METSKLRKRTPTNTLLDPAIVLPAIGQAFVKLDPRSLAKNPVMFVLEMVTILTSVLLVRDYLTGGPNLGFEVQIVIWLWFTVLFANFAEAVAEGRGKAQADTLRKTRTQTRAKRVLMSGQHRALRGRIGGGTGSRRPRRLRGGRYHSRRRRGDRGHRVGQRGRGHGRVRAGHPRVRRRPFGRHGRHHRHFRPDRDPHHVLARHRRSSTA